jgi:hypothetical protein
MNLTGLSSENHRDLKLSPTPSYRHAEGFHSVALAAGEITKAALSYPVLFIRTETGFHPIALLSLIRDENQYLSGDAWQATYIPAAIRLYPFRLAGEQVLIDESAPNFADAEGEPLFTAEGEPTPVLNTALGFLRTCHAAEAETQRWCEHLAKLELLTGQRLDVVSPRGTRYRLDGFHVVDAAKIALLPDTTLTLLVRDGSLALIHAHLLSLEHLVTLAAQRDRLGDDLAKATADPDADRHPGLEHDLAQ